jgi:hypothetical protein
MLKFLKNYAYAVRILPSKESWNCYHLENFWNAVRQPSHNTRVKILESLLSGGRLECDAPTLALHGSNESWNRYHPEEVWNVMCPHSHYMG